jgi:hypothetical protein
MCERGQLGVVDEFRSTARSMPIVNGPLGVMWADSTSNGIMLNWCDAEFDRENPKKDIFGRLEVPVGTRCQSRGTRRQILDGNITASLSYGTQFKIGMRFLLMIFSEMNLFTNVLALGRR